MRFYLPRGHPNLWSRVRRVTQPQPWVCNMIQEELALVKQNGAWKPGRKKGWSGLFYPPNGLTFQFCWFNLIFWLLWVDPSPILFYFYFFIRSELVRVDPSRSESNFILFLFFYSIQVDLTRTGGPSWSGPTFVPAFFFIVRASFSLKLKKNVCILESKPCNFSTWSNHKKCRWHKFIKRN